MTSDIVDPSALVDQLEQALEAAAVPADVAPMTAYMKGRFPFLGVRSPARRAAQKPVVAQMRDAPADVLVGFVDECYARPEREFHYVGADAAAKYVKVLGVEHLDDAERWTETNGWWDTVDVIAATIVGGILARPGTQDGWDRVDTWADVWEGDEFWLARVAILHQLKYKAATDEAVLFDRCRRRAADTEFFIRKAIGWALREYAKTNPDAVRSFVDANRDVLSGLSIREAMKHLGRPNL